MQLFLSSIWLTSTCLLVIWVVQAKMIRAIAEVPRPVAQVTQVSGNLLSVAQRKQLLQLPIPVLAPTALPAGFRLVSANGEKGQLINGDDDSGYALLYLGNHNTCLRVQTSQDGPRGLQKVGQASTDFGSLPIYAEKAQGRTTLSSFIPLKGNSVVTTGGFVPTPSGEWQPCNALTQAAFAQVLRSVKRIQP